MHASPERFKKEVVDVLEDPEHELFLSAASSWEIAIKHSIGKLPLPIPPADYVLSRLSDGDVLTLDVSHRHALEVARLPKHHRDPFDRILIAQARLEGLTLLTADRALEAYEVKILFAS